MFGLLFVTFRVILSVKYSSITVDQSTFLALKSRITHDPHNFVATNWSTSTSVCNWIGVTCGSRHHRVTALNLSLMDLMSTILFRIIIFMVKYRKNLLKVARYKVFRSTTTN
ncbi:hypothetical protein Goklo_029810 [Gossypium klotzschianum]|uniref:Leucine-rich repeat-containing N-terminal plant-type domain-containing protein n=1 Tax=Gossypium klotzschianum TaxID=34286 RepID=A0A7J8W6N6_9ROSI|nr:hypothetical protein [Gossypium klotzschianum]